VNNNNNNNNNSKLLSTSSLSPLCRVFIHIFLRQTMSLRNTMLLLFCLYCLWRPYQYSCVSSYVILLQYFPKYVCSAQYGSSL
jgi:hypothetical protein